MKIDEQTANVKAFFSNRTDYLSLFEAIEKMISSIGPAKVDVMKTHISFGTNRKFAWISLAHPRSKNHPKNLIILSFYVGRQLKNEKIADVVETSPGQWTHEIIIQNASDINKVVFTCICEAYTFSLIKSRKLKTEEEIFIF